MKLSYGYELVRVNTANFVNYYRHADRFNGLDYDTASYILRGIFMEALQEAGKLADRMGWDGVELTVVSTSRPYDVKAVCADEKRQTIVQMTLMRRGDGPERSITAEIYNDFTWAAR